MSRDALKHPVHPLITRSLDKGSNELLLGGKTLSEIEGMLGRTPFYVYDKQHLKQNVEELMKILPSKIKLHYAIKANPYPPVVNYLTNLVDGFDVASKKEMLLALQTEMPPEEISFAGPGKTEEDLKSAIIAGITLHVESENEINRAIKIGKTLNILPQIAIRVNPAFELKASGMKMSGGPKQFGIDEELVPDILNKHNLKDYKLRGFHIFAGSQNLKQEAIIEAHNNTFELAAKLIKVSPATIDYVNIGGGLGVPYFPGENHLDLSLITLNLKFLIKKYQSVIEEIDLIMELGRYLVASCGVYVCKVVDKKKSRGVNYLVCDGGLHHHLANSGNFGQVIRKNYPLVIGNKLNLNNELKLDQVEVVGPLCTPLDILGNKISVPKPEVGDFVVILQSGAYGATASPQNFLSQKQFLEILL